MGLSFRFLSLVMGTDPTGMLGSLRVGWDCWCELWGRGCASSSSGLDIGGVGSISSALLSLFFPDNLPSILFDPLSCSFSGLPLGNAASWEGRDGEIGVFGINGVSRSALVEKEIRRLTGERAKLESLSGISSTSSYDVALYVGYGMSSRSETCSKKAEEATDEAVRGG